MKLKLSLFYLIIFLSNHLYCQINTISYIFQKKINFEINNLQGKRPFCIRSGTFKNKLYISYFDDNTKKIYINYIDSAYQFINADSINFITPYRRGYQHLINYKLINEDTIILAYNPAYGDLYIHDTSILMLNLKGKILATASFKNTNVPTWNAVKNDNYIGFMGETDVSNKYNNFFMTFEAPLNYNQQKKYVLASFSPFSVICKTCDNFDTLINYAASFLYFDTLKSTNLYPIHFPCTFKNKYYPREFNYVKLTYNSKNNYYIFGFGLNNNVTILNDDGLYSYKKLESYLIDTVYPYHSYYDENNDFNRSEFLSFSYNLTNNEIYRKIRVGKSFFEGDSSQIQEKYCSRNIYIMQVFDSTLNLKGEGILPFYASGYYIPFEKGILIYNEKESYTENRIIFDYYTLTFNASDTSTYKEQVRGELLALNRPLYSSNYRNYLMKLKPNNNFKYVFIFNNERTTVSAKIFWQDYFKNNFKKFENDSIAIIFISSSRSKTLKDFNLTKEYKNVFIDDKFIYNDFIGPIVHCQYVDLRTDNFDIDIYDAPHTYEIVQKLEVYNKHKNRKKENPFNH